MFDRRALVSQLRDQRGALLESPNDYGVVVGFLAGCDAVTFGGFLAGFQELVELKNGATSDVHWSKLAPIIRWPEGTEAVEDLAKIEWLLELLEELVLVDSGPAGIRRIHYEWASMARQEPSHDEDLIRFGESPAPEYVSVDAAQALIGFLRSEILELANQGHVRSGRIGGEVLIERDAIEALSRPPKITHTYSYGPVDELVGPSGHTEATTPDEEPTPDEAARFAAAMLSVLDAGTPTEGHDEAALAEIRRLAEKLVDPPTDI